MKKIIKLTLVLLSTIGLILGTTSTSFSKVEGDTIILGAAVSLTGKYSSNGVHTQNGYNMAVDRINSMGGVKVDGKSYKYNFCVCSNSYCFHYCCDPKLLKFLLVVIFFKR